LIEREIMSRKTLRSIVLVTGAFATGVITGLLISPGSGRDNREWINQNAKEAGDWIDKKSREAAAKGEKKVHEYSERIKKGVKDSISNISEATKN
jgi:gas vesicle protein